MLTLACPSNMSALSTEKDRAVTIPFTSTRPDTRPYPYSTFANSFSITV